MGTNKKKKMRKLLIICLTIALVSCNRIENPSGETPINFDRVLTKAVVDDVEDIDAFGVYAQISTTPEGTDYVSLMTNERVYQSDSEWTYDNKCYWIKDRKYRFFSIYPYETNSSNIVFTTHRQNGRNYDGYQISFVLPESTDTDLMTASKNVTVGPNQTVYENVVLSFKHELAKININVAKNRANANNRVEVTSITLGGIWKNGTLNTAFDPEFTTNWSFYGSTTTNIWKNFDNGKVISTDNTPMIEDIMLMPQNIGAQSIPIYITYKFYGVGGDLQNTTTATAYIPMGKWDAAKNYTYNIILAAEDNTIKISTPIVASWGALQSGSTIIIQ